MKNEKPQNPSAFPAWDMTFEKNPNTDLFSAGTSQGMTLRDYFAAKAMQVMCKLYDPELTSKKAYEMADKMLKQREL